MEDEIIPCNQEAVYLQGDDELTSLTIMKMVLTLAYNYRMKLSRLSELPTN